MRIELNGELREVEEGSTAREAALAAGIDAERRGVAVAVDGEVVPRSELGEVVLREGAKVEVVTAIQGGSG